MSKRVKARSAMTKLVFYPLLIDLYVDGKKPPVEFLPMAFRRPLYTSLTSL